MSDTGMYALGRCIVCQRAFTFDPYKVPSVAIDPQTGRPPDVDEHAQQVTPDTDSVQRAIREPVCGHCIGPLNAARRGNGMPEIIVLRGAYGDGGGW